MHTFTILRNTHLSGSNFLLEVAIPQDFTVAPGQFCMLQASVSGYDPLLKRPLSIASAGDGVMGFAYKVVGRGTHILSTFREGQPIDILGPLGNGFTLQSGDALLIGGGIGIAPLLMLAEHLKSAGNTVNAIIGASSAENLLFEKELDRVCDSLIVTTDDGTRGHKGFVTQAIGGDLTSRHVYCCGPDVMMNAVGALALKAGAASCQLSLETHMACGIGVCLGCVTDTYDSGQMQRKTVCKEGPVFSAAQLECGQAKP